MKVNESMGMKLRSRESGQTLIVAILILGILLILGFAFAQIIGRSISEAGRQNQRTVASDLSRSGINATHSQLVNSELGADWRPEPTQIAFDAAGFSRDPDALYLRPAPVPPVTIDLGNGETFIDMGGPDFKGPFARTDTDKGRRLVRVRYAPGDFDSMVSTAPSALRQPGKAQKYILIESVGRPGKLTVNGRIDVSKQLPEAIQIANYVSMAQVVAAVSAGRAIDSRHNADQRKMKAFASIGITEHGRTITNKHKVNRPAELGIPLGRIASSDPFAQSDLTVQFNDAPGGAIPVDVQTAWGYGPAAAQLGRPTWANVPGGGSLYSNASIKWHGDGFIALNRFLGENWKVNGAIMPADPSTAGPNTSSLTIRPFDFNRATNQWQPLPDVMVGGTALNSDRGDFSTQNGLLQDGARQDVDPNGNPRGVGRLEPPSILARDPQSNVNRYQNMASSSGPLVGNINIGRLGYGRNVYVDSSERGNLDSEDERRQQAGVRNLTNDWLNPNNAGSLGWQGPFYVPVASYLHLLPDGFEIIRDSRSRQRYWRRPTGGSTGESTCRYRVRYVDPTGTGRFEMYIINSVENPGLISAPINAVSDADFITNGRPFGGVIYFEGDTRVRGVIPTDIQLSVVSMGSVYIDGSITKGRINIHNNGYRPGLAFGQVLNRPSSSMIMLMARDYVVLNTTQFFGPVPGASPAVKSTDVVADTPSPIELDIADSPELTLMTQFVTNPLTGNPFPIDYNSGGGPVAPEIFLSSAADDNGPGFLQLDIRPNTWAMAGPDYGFFPFDVDYTFGATTVQFNAAAQYYVGPPATIPIYGLGEPSINAYPRFETIGFPLTTLTTDVFNNQIRSEGGSGMYHMAINDPTLFRLRTSAVGPNAPKNWLLSRAVVAPHDIRIEAAMFAEEGSFFVIPGHWFNTNPDDSRLDYNNGTGAYATVAPADRSLHRYQTFGATASTPFYAEPVDVRISIFGAISENMPAPMSQQVEWLKKWGWIPRELGESGVQIPVQHDPNNLLSDPSVKTVPNLILTYDPNLANATFDGSTPVRTDGLGRVLPPMPRLPVSPTLAFIGDGE